MHQLKTNYSCIRGFYKTIINAYTKGFLSVSVFLLVMNGFTLSFFLISF